MWLCVKHLRAAVVRWADQHSVTPDQKKMLLVALSLLIDISNLEEWEACGGEVEKLFTSATAVEASEARTALVARWREAKDPAIHFREFSIQSGGPNAKNRFYNPMVWK